MKVLRSKIPNATPTVPIRGGFRVQFQDGRATVPDDVAMILAGLAPQYYSVLGDVHTVLPDSRVLIVRDMGLGDVLLCTPLIRALRHSAPGSDCSGLAIDVLTCERYRCLFDGNPNVRRTLALESDNGARAEWDIVLDLRLVVENAEGQGFHLHRADAFAEYADLHPGEGDRHLDFFLRPDEANQAAELLRPLTALHGAGPGAGAGIVAYVWRASTSQRSWSAVTHRRMLQTLCDAGFRVVVLDHQPQAMVAEMAEAEPFLLDATGRLSIRQLAAVLAACDVCLTPDTGAFHLAAAVDTPTVAYLGAFPASERATHRSLAVLNNPEPCGHLRLLGGCRTYHCLCRDGNDQPRCLDVTPGTVLSAIEAQIRQKKA